MFKSMVVTLLCIASSTLAARAQTLPQMRMTPTEIKGSPTDKNQIGSSGLAAVHAQVTIEAHRDNRVATVVSGEWHFGYGDHFDVKRLKTLPPGSVYSEPGSVEHIAQTAETAVVVQISGYGPTDTKYFDPANDPANKK